MVFYSKYFNGYRKSASSFLYYIIADSSPSQLSVTIIVIMLEKLLGQQGNDSTPDSKPRRPHHIVLDWYRNLKKWQQIVVGAVAMALIAGIISGIWALTQGSGNQAPVIDNQEISEPEPTTEPSRLTGIPVEPAYNKRPVTAVMIENSLDARPQSGLYEAGIVFEAIAEGGITRFMALYQEAQPKSIGPIRSLRPYYLDFAMPFQASIAHVGGSPDALAQARALNVRDLDQFSNAGTYERVSSRYAPHNVYSSMSKLDALNKAKGFTSSEFTSLARKQEAPAEVPSVQRIALSISSQNYKVGYVYDATTNSYKRSLGGAAHKDQVSGKQISPKVVIVPVMSRSQSGIYSVYDAIGSGPLFVYQDGGVTKGTWEKTGRKAQFKFKTNDGKTLELNAGQTWITVLDSASKVSHSK